MIKIKVTPTKGTVKAPYTIEKVSSSIKNPITTAENQAKAKSGLGRFEEWIFVGEKIK